MNLHPNHLLLNKYRLVECVKNNESYQGWKALNPQEKKVYCKVYQLNNWEDFVFLQKNFEVASELQLPFSPQLLELEVDESKGMIVLVRLWIEGKSLEEMALKNRWTETSLHPLVLQSLDYLSQLHSYSPQVFHLNLHPSNLLWSPQQELFFLDMMPQFHPVSQYHGFSYYQNEYSAPELMQNRKEKNSDGFSIGMILLHLLSKKSPWELEVVDSELQIEKEINVSKPFLQWLKRLVAMDTDKRWRSSEVALQEFHHILGTSKTPSKEKHILFEPEVWEFDKFSEGRFGIDEHPILNREQRWFQWLEKHFPSLETTTSFLSWFAWVEKQEERKQHEALSEMCKHFFPMDAADLLLSHWPKEKQRWEYHRMLQQSFASQYTGERANAIGQWFSLYFFQKYSYTQKAIELFSTHLFCQTSEKDWQGGLKEKYLDVLRFQNLSNENREKKKQTLLHHLQEIESWIQQLSQFPPKYYGLFLHSSPAQRKEQMKKLSIQWDESLVLLVNKTLFSLQDWNPFCDEKKRERDKLERLGRLLGDLFGLLHLLQKNVSLSDKLPTQEMEATERGAF